MKIIAEYYLDGLNEKNCNYRLDQLYKKRDQASGLISKFTTNNNNVMVNTYENLYDIFCNTIDKLLEFRNNHNCLLEGDDGYGETE